MGCDILTTGRSIGCSDNMAGIKAVYFTNDDLGAITYDTTNTELIMTFAGTPEFFKWELEGAFSNYTEPMTKTIGNGTRFRTQTLALQFPKMDALTRNEINKLDQTRFFVVVEDFNGQFFLMGRDNQAYVTVSDSATGAGRGDFNGYSMTITAEEKEPANFIKDSLTDTGATISAMTIQP